MPTKVCTKCKQVKDVMEFYEAKDKPCGRRSHCIACLAAHYKSKHPTKPKRPREMSKQEYQKRYHILHKEETRMRMIPYSYGISVDEYDRRVIAQEGVCAICGKPETAKKRGTESSRRLSVDHNHTTKAVRGLLCGKCNVGLGFLNDDYGLLISAAEYIQYWNRKESHG